MRKLMMCGAMLTLAAGVGGCGSDESITDLKPEGPPEVLQVFLNVRLADGNPAMALAYGEHPKWDPDLDGPKGPQTEVIVNAEQKIRVVVDELLDGNTLEIFKCACAAGTCASGDDYTDDPALCGDDTATPANETGLWLDVDSTTSRQDGMPDEPRLRPNIARISCGGLEWTNTDPAEGFYNPTGNQLVSQLFGAKIWDSLGPAIVLTPISLPTGRSCSIAFADSVTDKQGEPIAMPSFTFQTEALKLLSSQPEDGETGVDRDLESISLTMNAPLNPATVNPTNVTISPAIAGATIGVSPDGTSVLIQVPARLDPNTRYTVELSTGVADSYGSALQSSQSISFTTGAN